MLSVALGMSLALVALDLPFFLAGAKSSAPAPVPGFGPPSEPVGTAPGPWASTPFLASLALRGLLYELIEVCLVCLVDLPGGAIGLLLLRANMQHTAWWFCVKI